jgi:hypothetical protein
MAKERHWKVHDHGKVTFVWDQQDRCEELSHSFSYERLGLYYLTKKVPQHFCDLHLMWGTNVGARYWSAAYYTKPGDSGLSMDTTRSMADTDRFSGKVVEMHYDAMGNPITDQYDGLSEKLDLLDGGYVVYIGDPRSDAELSHQAQTFHNGKQHFKDRIGRKRDLECWLLGPVSLIAGGFLWGSIVVKLQGRFEKNQGFQHCSLWGSHYCQDGSVSASTGDYHGGSLQGRWEGDDPNEETKILRQAPTPLDLPPYANGVVWKREQYEHNRTMCQAKAMAGSSE